MLICVLCVSVCVCVLTCVLCAIVDFKGGFDLTMGTLCRICACQIIKGLLQVHPLTGLKSDLQPPQTSVWTGLLCTTGRVSSRAVLPEVLTLPFGPVSSDLQPPQTRVYRQG